MWLGIFVAKHEEEKTPEEAQDAEEVENWLPRVKIVDKNAWERRA